MNKPKFQPLVTDGIQYVPGHGPTPPEETRMFVHGKAGENATLFLSSYIHDAEDHAALDAYARLFASAPDLLAACREALDKICAEHYSIVSETWDDADASEVAMHLDIAISKAEGGGK